MQEHEPRAVGRGTLITIAATLLLAGILLLVGRLAFDFSAARRDALEPPRGAGAPSRVTRRVPYDRLKRALDFTLALLALIALAPLLLGVALLVRRKIGSPVLFRQERPGLHNQPFTILKFRTMTDARDASGRLLPDAERITPLGRFLRRSSLDELPELVNVLKGEMSLVGPRPLFMHYLQYYTPEQARRHEVRPGITGWAQIHGRNALAWEDKFRLDVWYVDHRSLALDLKIVALTLWKVLRQEGISQEGQATVEYFRGSPAPAAAAPAPTEIAAEPA